MALLYVSATKMCSLFAHTPMGPYRFLIWCSVSCVCVSITVSACNSMFVASMCVSSTCIAKGVFMFGMVCVCLLFWKSSMVCFCVFAT